MATYISSKPITPVEELATTKSKKVKSGNRQAVMKQHLKDWDASWEKASETS